MPTTVDRIVSPDCSAVTDPSMSTSNKSHDCANTCVEMRDVGYEPSSRRDR
ncbi:MULTISPECIES: hypothetical protein [unclassified Rhodococcus (in: high G+C Gram-positive bacteria)]|uniref:hypothetical protein n=1 Tax=unclassified Rhodococcus (in: high G+C Gram-positive bacteria) TaxID=192944 RepID=UPI0015C5A7C3|nr:MULTISPECIES: hypothetical protein [unclassified Rhodococcus (in: high G+C Gram-positive bacteria)]